jgi:hypothetical protein
MNNSKAIEEKTERIVNAFFTGRRQQTFWFWAVGFGIVIPVLTYVSSGLLSLIVGLVLALLGVSSDTSVRWVTVSIIVVCGLASLVAYYKLWVLWNRKMNENGTAHNRVKGSFELPLPTPPGVRVRTGRFTEPTEP